MAKINKSKGSRTLEEVNDPISQGESITDIDEEKVKIVIFTLLDHYYALSGANVKEILPRVKIHFVPGAPDYLHGIINVRGDIESVLNMNRIFGLADEEITDHNRIIIAEKHGTRSGILVKNVEDVVDIPVSTIKNPISCLPDNLKEFVAGEIEYQERNVNLVEIGNIFKQKL